MSYWEEARAAWAEQIRRYPDRPPPPAELAVIERQFAAGEFSEKVYLWLLGKIDDEDMEGEDAHAASKVGRKNFRRTK